MAPPKRKSEIVAKPATQDRSSRQMVDSSAKTISAKGGSPSTMRTPTWMQLAKNPSLMPPGPVVNFQTSPIVQRSVDASVDHATDLVDVNMTAQAAVIEGFRNCEDDRNDEGAAQHSYPLGRRLSICPTQTAPACQLQLLELSLLEGRATLRSLIGPSTSTPSAMNDPLSAAQLLPATPDPEITFPLFGNLCTELRAKVWKAASEAPRVISVQWAMQGQITTARKYNIQFSISTPPSSLLTACIESHQAVLKTLTTTLDLGNRQRIRYNPTKDTILLCKGRHQYITFGNLQPDSPLKIPVSEVLNPDFSSMFSGVKNVAFHLHGTYLIDWPQYRHLGWLLTQFSSLEHVVVIPLGLGDKETSHTHAGYELSLKTTFVNEDAKRLELGLSAAEEEKFKKLLVRRLERWDTEKDVARAWKIPDWVIRVVEKASL